MPNIPKTDCFTNIYIIYSLLCFFLTSGNNTIKAIVYNISPTGEAKDGGSSKEMVIPVEIDILDEDPRLIAGVTAQAKILIDKKENVFKVPFEALLDVDGESYLIIEKSGILKRVAVKIGLESDVDVEVSASGLKAGDAIVLSPDQSYIDGMKVDKEPDISEQVN